MEEVKVHIQRVMLLKFKNNKITETVYKSFSVYGQLLLLTVKSEVAFQSHYDDTSLKG